MTDLHHPAPPTPAVLQKRIAALRQVIAGCTSRPAMKTAAKNRLASYERQLTLSSRPTYTGPNSRQIAAGQKAALLRLGVLSAQRRELVQRAHMRSFLDSERRILNALYRLPVEPPEGATLVDWANFIGALREVEREIARA